MARKGNNPDRMDTEKETGSKRRYQSPQTPPQPPRSSPGTQQGRGQERRQDGQDIDTEDYGTEDYGEEASGGRGTSQEQGQDQRQGRGMSESHGGAQDWQDDVDSEGSFGARGHGGRGSNFDLQKASRDELNAIAVELGIEDYETMNREELVMEIRERS